MVKDIPRRLKRIVVAMFLGLIAFQGHAQAFNFSDVGIILDLTSQIVGLISDNRQQEDEFIVQQNQTMRMNRLPRDPDAIGSRWIAQAHGLLAIPLGDFADNMRENGWGFGGEILTNISGPVMAGIHMTGARFDNYSIGYNEVFEGELYEYDELAASRMLLGHIAVRFDPELEGIFKPYVQGLIGAHWYYSNTRIKDLGANEVVDRFNESSDVVLGFGAQAGVHIAPESWRNFGIDVRAGYLTNGSVEYMRYDPRLSSTNGYPIEFFEEKSSPVQMLTIQIGVFGRF